MGKSVTCIVTLQFEGAAVPHRIGAGEPLEEQDEKKRTRDKNDAIYNAFASTTYIPPLVNMEEAMKKVREKDYITHEESYSKLTGGYNPMKDMKTK